MGSDSELMLWEFEYGFVPKTYGINFLKNSFEVSSSTIIKFTNLICFYNVESLIKHNIVQSKIKFHRIKHIFVLQSLTFDEFNFVVIMSWKIKCNFGFHSKTSLKPMQSCRLLPISIVNMHICARPLYTTKQRKNYPCQLHFVEYMVVRKKRNAEVVELLLLPVMRLYRVKRIGT